MRGPKYWEAEAIEQTNKRLEEEEKLPTNWSTFGTAAMPLSELEGKQKRVARSPLMHRDSRLSMSRVRVILRWGLHVHIAKVAVVKNAIGQV